MAEEIAKILGAPVVELFEKVKDTKGQKFANFKQRQENMIGMYKLLPAKLCKDENILIVDDVITTCATINFCSGLISKQVKSVYVCAVARNKLKKNGEGAK